jgi:hypothetical protein
LRVDGAGSLFHHGSYYHTLTYAAARRELEQTVKTHYTTCQECARPLRWAVPAYLPAKETGWYLLCADCYRAVLEQKPAVRDSTKRNQRRR